MLATVSRASATKPAQPAAKRSVATAATSSRATLALPVVSVLSAAAVFLAGTPNVNAADLALGEQVFNGNCAACHTGGRNTVMPEKTMDRAAMEAYLDGGFNLEAIIHQVENGKGAMPAWADRLSEEEIQAVAEYVYNQANTDAWKY